jgi:hypothetical protein
MIAKAIGRPLRFEKVPVRVARANARRWQAIGNAPTGSVGEDDLVFDAHSGVE